MSSSFKTNLQLTADLIKKSKKIIIGCHRNPDGDAIGSLVGLGLGLLKLKKNVIFLCPDKVPDRYITLPKATHIKQEYHDNADLAIGVDCGSIVQLARLEQAFRESKRIIEIDHHVYRSRFGDVQLVDPHACSVGEIVHILLKELKVTIDKKIAECLLISCLVETSSFSSQGVNTTTFDFCSELMKSGVDYRDISERYYWRRKLSVIHLSGLCFNRTKPRMDGKLVWSMIKRKDYEKYHGSQEDVDFVPDEMMMVEDVEVALLFREVESNMLRVSLRSKSGLNIGYLATIYGGGGHRDVAGCRIHNNPRTVQKFINQACNLIRKKER